MLQYSYDGSLDTRWKSIWLNDPEWIIVGLKWPYEIHKIRITWEGAYAKDYIVKTALVTPQVGPASSMMRAPEAANWNTYAERTDYDGSNDLVEEFTNAANFLLKFDLLVQFRIFCVPRYTGDGR